MGIDVSALDFLLKFKNKLSGKCLQLGRQGFHIPRDRSRWERVLAERVLQKYDPGIELEALYSDDEYTEKLFKYLGIDSLQSMDASAYEGADIVHDLNTPVPASLLTSFDVIFDGGTLEHVFNFPQAISNVRNMLRIGGLYMSVTVANNWLGHGFYQFSPEVMWRAFSIANGFSVELLQLCPLDGQIPNPTDVPDPAVVGRRLEIGFTPTAVYLLVVARKIASQVELEVQQSDYFVRW
jgi:hypothetical protein